jgi:hypothetical protein
MLAAVACIVASSWFSPFTTCIILENLFHVLEQTNIAFTVRWVTACQSLLTEK